MAVTMMRSIHGSIVLSIHVPRKWDSTSQRRIILWHCSLRMTRDMTVGIFRMRHVRDTGAIRLGPPLKQVSRGDRGGGLVVVGSHRDEL